MNDQLEFIDDYFQKQLSDEQRSRFEARCISDQEFAKEVAFYISSREALREVLLAEKKKAWAAITPKDLSSDEESKPLRMVGNADETAGAPVRKMQVKKWLSLAVAASVILAIIIYPLVSKDSGQDLVQNYVSNDLSRISNTMDASRDSMQTAINAFNEKKYQSAIDQFKIISESDPANNDALKYLGQSYLLAGNYDNALESFRALAAKPGLYSNPGLFLQAVTLVQRHDDGDLAAAKQLFEQVVSQKLDGEKQAAEWIRHLD
ncbi:MAG: tetratricopeptide repeat protein [Flavitalea sp.]